MDLKLENIVIQKLFETGEKNEIRNYFKLINRKNANKINNKLNCKKFKLKKSKEEIN